MSTPDPNDACCPMLVMFTVRDMKASLAFYRDTLGFEMKESWPDAENPWWCSLMLNGQTVMLGVASHDGECGEGHGEADDAQQWMVESMKRFESGPSGAGAYVYLTVEDVDAHHDFVCSHGGQPKYAPKTQFYGIRDFAVEDPDGYALLFFMPVKMESCQSCGMPLADAAPGQMYCPYCVDDGGQLKSYEQVFEGTVTGFFMGMQKMSREDAEAAATEHLAKMPAWVGQTT